MLSVVTLGIAGGEFVAQAADPAHAPVGASDGLEPLADTVADALDAHGAVLAIYPTWHAEPALQQLQTIRSMLEAPRVLVHGTSLPPLAGATLAGLAAAMADRGVPPGVLAGALTGLESRLAVFAWAGSVARLRRPAPTLGQHVRSWKPRSSFWVSVQPEEAVVPLGRQVGPLLDLALDQRVVVAGPRIDEAWLNAAAATIQRTPDHVLDEQPLVAEWWGTGKIVEGVAYPADLDALARELEATRPAACGWCGEDTTAAPCPFCGMARSQDVAQPHEPPQPQDVAQPQEVSR
jgi:hypothetical protein